MKPICVPCHRYFRPEENGVSFIEGMPAADYRAEPGLAEPDSWKPYKLWMGDRWKCHGCGATIIVGTGRKPLAEHYEHDFQKQVEQLGATFQVNDC